MPSEPCRNPRIGAIERRNRCRSSQAAVRAQDRQRWPRRRRRASAGGTRVHPCRERAVGLDPSRMSSSRSAMISRARRPRRASSNRTARSRRPIAVERSQLSIARWACSAEIALGIGGVVVQVATAGTAATSSAEISPRYWAKRRNERNPLVTHFKAAGPSRFDSCRTNAMASIGRRSCRQILPARSASQELPGRPRVALDGDGARPAGPVGAARSRRQRGQRRWHAQRGSADPLLAQELQQQSQRLSFLAPRIGASRRRRRDALVPHDVIVCQFVELDATRLAPSAECQRVPRLDADVAGRYCWPISELTNAPRRSATGHDRATRALGTLIGTFQVLSLRAEAPGKEDSYVQRHAAGPRQIRMSVNYGT